MRLWRSDQSVTYESVVATLRTSYNGGAAHRDRVAKEAWKVAERDRFLQLLSAENSQHLLEIGAGTGQDSVFFTESGLDVIATDLSPAMVSCCRDKGIDARVVDFLGLTREFAHGSFDAVYALNCLLHVPADALARVLSTICTVLRPDGLFFLGVYGGDADSGIAEHDNHDPPRFFCFRTDDELLAFARKDFDIVDFHVLAMDVGSFQSLTLRRPDPR